LYPSEDDIHEVIRGCLKNDRRSQEELYKRYYPAMMALCLRYVGNPGDAVEILNDAFLKVFRQMGRYEAAKGALYTWMQKMIRYHEMPTATEPEPGIENEAISKLNSDELLGLIRQLPLTTCLVFNLHGIDGFSHREIADMLGISEGTSRWHLSDARRQLKQIINPMEPNV
jgi:RNA polymerase sigma factor (sigma-70 family)